MFAVIGAVVEFVVVKLGIFPVPLAAKPISVLSLVHVYEITPSLESTCEISMT